MYKLAKRCVKVVQHMCCLCLWEIISGAVQWNLVLGNCKVLARTEAPTKQVDGDNIRIID